MSALRFPSDDALVAVLAAHIVPDDVTGLSVRWGRDDDGLWLVPEARVDDATRALLHDRGVELGEAGGVAHSAACWAEVLSPRRVPEPDEANPALFLAPAADLVSLAGELLRLGCDRQRWAVSDALALLHTQDPPWYTVLKALDPSDPVRVFVQAVPRVWVEVGYVHPLAEAIRPPEGELVLIPGEGPWIRSSDGPWTALYDRLDLVLPEAPRTLVPDGDPPRIPVPLRLVDSGRTQAPSLWVIRSDARAKIDRMLASLPDDLVTRLLFAASSDDPPTVVLRARPSPQGPPAIEVPGERYAPLLELPNLYRPDDTTLEPPLRRDKVREILSPEPYEVAWLARTESGFVVERIAEEAFRPLPDWVEYVAHRAGAPLASWVESATFEFDDWVDLGVEWATANEERKAKPKARGPTRPVASEPEVAYEPTEVVARPRKVVQAKPKAVEIVSGAEENAVARELAEVEQKFLAMDAPPDAPDRLPLWRHMATLTRKLGRNRDASLCWAHALWDAPPDRREELATAWASEELGTVGLDADTLRAAVIETPEPERLYATAACLVAGALLPDAGLATLFDENDESVDVRTAWLARRVLAGDDELAVARARDRLLVRIRHGLSLERDTPVFLRMIDAAAIETLGTHLQAQYDHFHRTKRNRNVIEADPALTLAYVNLIFAWGFAALGDRLRTRAMSDRVEALDRKDPIHDALVAAYLARIEQALEGVPREAPLPPSVAALFNTTRDGKAMGQLERYKIDRLRQASGILETQERLDPFTAFNLGFEDPRGEEFAGMREVDDPDVLRPRLGALLDKAAGVSDAKDKGRLVDGVLDFLPLLPPADALPLLERSIELFGPLDALERTKLLEDALLVSGQLGRADLVRTLVMQMQDALQELTAEHLAQSGESLAKGLRSLRRVGLQQEAADLLQGVIERASGRDIESLMARVAVAGGLSGVGQEAAAVRILDEGLAALDGEIAKPAQRLRLTRTLAIALSSSPRPVALERLPKLAAHLAQITDAFNTNSHFCLSVLNYAESVVLGYTDANLALGPTARRWLDEAEYLVRRRIHAES
ncbi:MAG: hypothetical protein H6737_02740 [Alphaproteobacteria bacterium]|nr:hypothetical protein [Alphaproteobacteria bacterium]